MTDSGNEKITNDLPTESSVNEDDCTIEANGAELVFRRTERDRDIRMYKKLISMKSRFSDVIIVQILRVLASSDEIGDERVLLGSVAFATVLHGDYTLEDSTSELKKCWSLREPFLSSFDETFQIHDLQWFKLAITHGYLQLNVENIYTPEMICLAFEILRENCLTYTKYSYIAYKTLQAWLSKTMKMNFWHDNDTIEMESKLEAIIFSNWDNCINDIVRRNATKVFSMYLRIMCKKYDGFLKLIFENCIQNLSWQNVTKYTILFEVCEISEDLTSIVNSGLTSCIFTSLTKNHLKHAGTLVYLAILKKLNINDWQNIFGEDFFRISAKWESEKELTAIEFLWEQWMKPTIQKFSNIIEYLWKHPSMKRLELSQTYLEKMGDQQSFKLIYDDTTIRDILKPRVVHISETVRLNAFAVISRGYNWKIDTNEAEPFIIVKRFLYFNADASTISMRKGIIENFKIFLANAIKLAGTNCSIDRHVRQFLGWLHTFFSDCFEIGSSYQRKILGLSLYGIILNFTTDNFVDCLSARTTKYEATLKYANALRRSMIEENCWKFCDRESAILLLKLVMDQIDDVRDKSTLILIRYFDPDVFTNMEKQILMKTALENCNSSRFHEIAGGSALMRILVAWRFANENYVDFFLKEATVQLSEMKKDILKSATQGSSFFGALTAILQVGLTNETANETISDDSIRKILNIVEEATIFFLSALSTNEEDSEYSSSFKDMSIAIEETIRNSEISEINEECILSPAHQIVVSCIWMSLKVSCELAAEIGCRGETEEIVSRAANLIVSVSLKCRHKGAIEAAGKALAKLTRVLCKGKYDGVMKRHLENLLSIDSRDNINLTRRGAGLTIMFHHVVSNDQRNNRPFVHFAMGKLLNSLKTKTFLRNEDCQRDSTWSRHLHFLRSLIADKALQSQLVQYMEDVCLLCLKYLKSSDWTVRNASLQLFGAIVPRLVGQCSARELDYGIGNSVDHFVTHYPILAANILDQLKESTSAFDWRENIRSNDLPISVNNVVPILTLLSKMSTGGCDLVDYSSRDYIIRAKNIFLILLANPVFHVRGLAAKAYAAFVPFADIRYELTTMMLRKINWYQDNYNHGLLLVQFYLRRKYEHEIVCTSEKFVIRKSEIYEDEFKVATSVQLARVGYCLKKEMYTMFGPSRANYTFHNLCCFAISALLLDCLIDCPIATSMERYAHDKDRHVVVEHQFVSSLFTKRLDVSPMLGMSEFIKNLIAFNGQFLTCPHTRLFYMKHATNFRHYAIFAKNPEDISEDSQLDSLVADALEIVHDSLKTDILMHELSTILAIVRSRRTSEELKKRLIELCELLKSIDEESARPCARKLGTIGHMIAIELTTISESLLEAAIKDVVTMIREKVYNDVESKNFIIDSPLRLSENILGECGLFLDNWLQLALLSIAGIIALLTNEDKEMRELTSDNLHILTRTIDETLISFCSRANFHNILNSLFHSVVKFTSYSALKLIEDITNDIIFKTSKDGLKSPYEQDETFQLHATDLMNILFYYVKTNSETISVAEKRDYLELQWIDGTILAKYELQRIAGVNLTDIENYLKLSTWDYLTSKRGALIEIIQQRGDSVT